MRIGRHVHGPKHGVVPATRITDEQCVLNSPPRETIVAHSVSDEVVVGQDEVKEMVDAIVIDDVNVAQCLSRASCFGIHEEERLVERKQRLKCDGAAAAVGESTRAVWQCRVDLWCVDFMRSCCVARASYHQFRTCSILAWKTPGC